MQSQQPPTEYQDYQRKYPPGTVLRLRAVYCHVRHLLTHYEVEDITPTNHEEPMHHHKGLPKSTDAHTREGLSPDDPLWRSQERINLPPGTEVKQLLDPQFVIIAQMGKEDAQHLQMKDKSYGSSWRKRGGVGAFMMLARKWDRLERMCEQAGYDIFALIKAEGIPEPGMDPPDDSVLAQLRDLRRYLFLVDSWLSLQETNPYHPRHLDVSTITSQTDLGVESPTEAWAKEPRPHKVVEDSITRSDDPEVVTITFDSRIKLQTPTQGTKTLELGDKLALVGCKDRTISFDVGPLPGE